MEETIFIAKNAEYEIIGEDSVIFNCFRRKFNKFMIPASVVSPNGKRYKVIGIKALSKMGRIKEPSSVGYSKIVSFNRSSEIQAVSLFFIYHCKSELNLPPKTKRIIFDTDFIYSCLINVDKSNKFVSVTGGRNITNHHPLEVSTHHFHRAHLSIRETVRIIANGAFHGNNSLKSIVFPSSVEIIGERAFSSDSKLRSIVFKKNSKLKKICKLAFAGIEIRCLNLPASLEEIEANAFFDAKIQMITFPSDTKLKKAEENAFSQIGSISIDVLAEIKKQQCFLRNDQLIMIQGLYNQ